MFIRIMIDENFILYLNPDNICAVAETIDGLTIYTNSGEEFRLSSYDNARDFLNALEKLEKVYYA